MITDLAHFKNPSCLLRVYGSEKKWCHRFQLVFMGGGLLLQLYANKQKPSARTMCHEAHGVQWGMNECWPPAFSVCHCGDSLAIWGSERTLRRGTKFSSWTGSCGGVVYGQPNCPDVVPSVTECDRTGILSFSLIVHQVYVNCVNCVPWEKELEMSMFNDGIWDVVCSCDHREVHEEPWSTHSFIKNNQDGVWDLFILLGSNFSQMCFENICGHLRCPDCQSWRVSVWPMSHLLTAGLQPATRGPPGCVGVTSYHTVTGQQRCTAV